MSNAKRKEFNKWLVKNRPLVTVEKQKHFPRTVRLTCKEFRSNIDSIAEHCRTDRYSVVKAMQAGCVSMADFEKWCSENCTASA